MKIQQRSESMKRGERLELFRRIIKLSPEEMIALMSSRESWPQLLEGEFLGSKHTTLEKLVEKHGLNVEWLLLGKGNPFSFLKEGSHAKTFKIFSYFFTDKETAYDIAEYVEFLDNEIFRKEVLEEVYEKEIRMAEIYAKWHDIYHGIKEEPENEDEFETDSGVSS